MMPIPRFLSPLLRPAAPSDAERHLRAIVDSAIDAIVSISADGSIRDANPATERLFGYDRGELIGRNVSILMPPSIAREHDGYIRKFLKTGDAKIIGIGREVFGRRKDGSEFPLELGVTERVAAGERLFIGVMRDRTERHAGEERVRRNEYRLQQSQEFANIGTWDWNIETGELYWSERIAPLFGYARGELDTSYENFLNAVHPDDRQSVVDAVNACVEDGAEYHIEHRVVWPDGSVRWLLEKGDVVRDDAGNPLHMLGVVQDVTRAKRAEQALVLAKEEADAANRAKSEFLSSMSHELRTPLNSIIGFSQILKLDEHKLDAEQLQNIEYIHRGGHHLLDLVNEVLDLAKIEAGKLSLSLEVLDPVPILEAGVALIAGQAAERDLAINDRTADCPDVRVRADQTRVKQVLLNLLSNAVKYNRPGGELTLAAAVTEQNMLRVSVGDTGPGIPEHRRNEVFAAFTRLDAEFSDIEGTGIGLTIAQRLISMMGGELGLESEVGVGSTFWFDLPLADGDGERATDGQTAKLDAGDGSVAGGRRTVLYIEDNQGNRDLMTQVFGLLPEVELEMARNAEIGVALANQMVPDVILMDIHLPGMDGFDALRWLRETERTREIPVIALSASAMPEDVERGRQAGFSAYLTKPFEISVFMSSLNDALQHKKI